jgi:hypothetical protein
MKKTAIDLDNLNELRRLEAIDRLVELDMTEGAEYTDEDARLILVMRRKTR